MSDSTDNLTNWSGIGCHPTPRGLTQALASIVAQHVGQDQKDRVELLDLFAGDGRLGTSAAERLRELGVSAQVTLMDVGEISIGHNKHEKIRGNVFEWRPSKEYDIVVCNPPYWRLTRERARGLGLDWKDVRSAGSNLYCLSILKALSLCRRDGIVVVIAPFGWIRGMLAESFRQSILTIAAAEIYPESSRRLFKGVSQDVALQVFRHRNNDTPSDPDLSLQFGSARVRFDPADKTEMPTPEDIRVRVGPLVWNRCKGHLTDKDCGGLPVIYGGFIRSDATLDMEATRYRSRRFISERSIPASFVSEAPMILFRRTLRGSLESWAIDSCSVTGGLKCVVENHAIVIEVRNKAIDVETLRMLVLKLLEEHCQFLGNPTLNTSAVQLATKAALRELKF